MGGFNRQIVFRSNALAGWPYGREFDYREVVDTGSGVAGAVGAVGVTAGSGALAGAMWFPPTRAVLDRLLPAPGTGPDDETLRRGRFRIEVVAQTASGERVQHRVGADLDPGYRGTAVMLGESALALAFDDLPEQGGVLTPMTAMGEVLAGRLRRQGFDIATTKIAVRGTRCPRPPSPASRRRASCRARCRSRGRRRSARSPRRTMPLSISTGTSSGPTRSASRR